MFLFIITMRESRKKQFEFLPHPADVKMRVWGKNKAELMRNAVLGVMNFMRPEYGEEKISREVRVESLDFPTLLVDFLSEVLAQADLGDEAYEEIKIDDMTDKTISATFFGRKVKKFEDDIKAVTYHDLTVEKKNDRWEAVVTFDI